MKRDQRTEVLTDEYGAACERRPGDPGELPTAQVPLWGIRPTHPGVSRWWGARAIFQDNGRGGMQVDYVGDRQAVFGDATDAQRRELEDWAWGEGRRAFQSLVEHLAPGGRRPHRALVGEYTIVANPAGTHGYILLGVWRTPPLPPPVSVDPEPQLVQNMRLIVQAHAAAHLDNFTGVVVPQDLVEKARRAARRARGWDPYEGESEAQEDSDLVLQALVKKGMVNPVLVDVQTASAFVQYWDKIPDALPPEKAQDCRNRWLNVMAQGKAGAPAFPVFQRSLAVMSEPERAVIDILGMLASSGGSRRKGGR